MSCLGISCFLHNSAAACVDRSRILAAAEEERFTRNKLDAGFPVLAARWCITESVAQLGTEPSKVCFFEKPLLANLRSHPTGERARVALARSTDRYRLLLSEIESLIPGAELCFASHHLSHAASAFLVSPFDEAAVLVMDGVGEYSASTIFHGRNGELHPVEEVAFPHSMGLLYAMVTEHLGFLPLRDEYKVMGLAAYGAPRLLDKLERLSRVDLEGAPHFSQGLRLCSEQKEVMEVLRSNFGPARLQEEGFEPAHADLAASVQALLERSVARMWARACKVVGSRNLCVAGGVALNCRANSAACVETEIARVFIQPAAGDAGAALGAALLGDAEAHGGRNSGKPLFDPFLGPGYSERECVGALQEAGLAFLPLEGEELVEAVCRRLVAGRVIAWFRGRAEFGPRALGHRSILADPGSLAMRNRLNSITKSREGFRPFAPAVADFALADYFDTVVCDEYMLFTAQVRPNMLKLIPAVVHIDGSARVQVVRRALNAELHDLLLGMQRRGRPPILLNTSLNHSSEPMVQSPSQAVETFMRTDIDTLILGNALVDRAEA